MEGSDIDLQVHRVLTGNLGQYDLPQIPQRVVRIYLSSTGVDSQTERNTFVERVYPKLKEYCRQRYGVDFQIVDFEWGIPQQCHGLEVPRDEIRAKELRKCQDLSAGPNFVAFLGQKYGECLVPSVIPETEYEMLQISLVRRDARAAALLNEWYRKDDNSIPPTYILTSTTEALSENTKIDYKKPEPARATWQEVRDEIKRALQKAADYSYLDGQLDEDSKQKYQMSEQDVLIRHGIEETMSSQDRCVLLIRNIVDLKNYVDDPKARDFAEIIVNDRTDLPEIDSACTAKLAKIKTRTKELLPVTNTLNYDVLWRYDDVIHPKLHAPYLNQLCTEFHDVLKVLIDKTVPNIKFDVEPDVYLETLQHWLCCKKISDFFYGNDDVATKLRNYLNADTNKPLVVYGEPGSGKTTLLSRLALEVATDSSRQTFCAIRYIGYTLKSSNIKQLMMTLIHQLLYALGRTSDDISNEIEDLQRYFHELLYTVSKEFKVVIFLDGLDKLIPECNAYAMSWIPTVLNSNIKLVLSTHPTKHDIFNTLMKEVVNDTNYILKVEQLTQDDAEGLLQYVLGLYGRTLTPQQQIVFKNAFAECSLPMFVQLMSHKARTLASYSVCDQKEIPVNIYMAIHRLFDGLEVKHGQVFVGRALGYLVSSVTGLSDCEMEDILSLDDDVLNAVFMQYHPPVRRIPYTKWMSLKNDVEQFLTCKEADDVTVYLWNHEEFENVIKERYLKEICVVQEMHSMLADYFLGTWAGRKKPVKVPKRTDNLVLLPCGHEADRLVSRQPLSFEVEGAPVRYNKRMFDQVPRHLYLAGRFKELNSLVLFNYEWLYNKIKALSLTHILSDFVLNPGEEATLVEEALRVMESTIQRNINNLAPEISGHLLPYYKTHANIRALVHLCDTAGLKQCALIPNFSYLQVPGSSLQYTISSQVCGDFYRLTNDDRYLLVKIKDSSFVYRYDVVTGEAKGNVFASNGDLYVTPGGKRFVIVDHVTEKAIKIHDSETGNFLGQLIVMNHIELKIGKRYKMDTISLTDERMAAIVTTDVSYLCIADLIECQFLQIIALDGKCDICEIHPNGRYVLCNSNEFLLTYDLYSLEHLCTVSAGYRPCAAAFTRDGLRGYLANPLEAKLLVLHLHRGVVEMAYKSPLGDDIQEDKIANLKVSPKDDMVLIRGANTILVYNRFSERVGGKFPRPADVPNEFRLPKSTYTDLYYTNADFSNDGNFLIAAIFRNVYLFNLSSGDRITTIQAPVGIISDMLISRQKNNVITHLQGSKDFQVWNIDQAVNQVSMLDKLTSEVEDIKLTSDNSIAYVRCKDSDELGIVDMRNGVMIDLLTHDSTIRDFASTPDGRYVLISCEPKKKNTAVKIWDMDERKIIKEFGNTSGYCIGAYRNQEIICVAQEELDFKAPFFITKFGFMTECVLQNTHPLSLKYILDNPFLTNDDQNVVVLTAQDYIENKAMFDTPTICVFSLDKDYKVSYYTPESFMEVVYIDEIKQVCQSSKSSNTVMVLYTTNAAMVDVNDNMTGKENSQLALLVLDISTGAILIVCEHLLMPGVKGSSVIFHDVQFCIDSEYNVFDINQMSYVGHLHNPGIPPKVICLNGNAVIYYKDTQICVMSIVTSKLIAQCDVHAIISNLKICSDDRTILVGCVDGTILSYVLIDPSIDDPETIIASLGSRQLDVSRSGRTSRNWDKVETDNCPTYFRPPSGMSMGPKEKALLKQVTPVPKIRPNSDTLIYLNERSKSCVLQ